MAEEIRALMARRRISGVALAVKIDRSQSYVSRRLTGDVAFDLDDLERIAAVLGVTPTDLLPLAARRAGQTTAVYSPLTEKPMTDRPPRGPGGGSPHNTHPTGGPGVRHSRRLGTPAAVAGGQRAA